MKYLLDTHALLWFMRETYHLPPAVLQAIEDAGSDAVVSMASLWEIAIKVSIGKLSLPKPFDELFPRSVPDSGLTLLPIEPLHLIAVSRMPFHHRDPFDRLLIAQAQVDGLTIITSDSNFSAYGVQLLW